MNVGIHYDSHQSTQTLASMDDQSTTVQHLLSMGKVLKLGLWVPHVLRKSNKKHHINICASLVTIVEKGCPYVNIKNIKG